MMKDELHYLTASTVKNLFRLPEISKFNTDFIRLQVIMFILWVANIFLAAGVASKASQSRGWKRQPAGTYIAPASTANHDLSSGRPPTHTCWLAMYSVQWSGVHGKLQMGIPARGAAAQAARWARGRNGAQRWPEVGTAAPAPPDLGPTTVPVHFPQTKVAGRVSRLAPWCGGGGTVSTTAPSSS